MNLRLFNLIEDIKVVFSKLVFNVNVNLVFKGFE